MALNFEQLQRNYRTGLGSSNGSWGTAGRPTTSVKQQLIGSGGARRNLPTGGARAQIMSGSAVSVGYDPIKAQQLRQRPIKLDRRGGGGGSTDNSLLNTYYGNYGKQNVGQGLQNSNYDSLFNNNPYLTSIFGNIGQVPGLTNGSNNIGQGVGQNNSNWQLDPTYTPGENSLMRRYINPLTGETNMIW